MKKNHEYILRLEAENQILLKSFDRALHDLDAERAKNHRLIQRLAKAQRPRCLWAKKWLLSVKPKG